MAEDFNALVAKAFERHGEFKPKILSPKKMRDRLENMSPKRLASRIKYRKQHREELNQKKREKRSTPEGKAKAAAENKKWREENREYDAARKKKWWDELMADPVKHADYLEKRRKKI